MYEECLQRTATALRDGPRTPTEFATAIADRIDEIDPEIRAFVDEADRRGRLRREAAAVEARFESWERPPLYGVPVGVKDIVHVDGLPTRAGSDVPPEELAGPEATVVSRLREAGAIVAGKTVTAEFAHFAPGPTRNPNDTDHTPGGSSSGSAAAVAAGIAPLALGTQTIGSVIRPAAFCGVVGVKPTRGRIPTDGLLTVSRSVDHVGYFTQDVAGARLAGDALCDDWDSPSPQPDRDPILGIPNETYLSQASATGRDRFEAHVDALEQAGYEIRRTDALSEIESINRRHRRLVAGDAAIAHHERYEEFGDRLHEETAALVEEGREVPTEEVAVGRASRDRLRDRLHEAMSDLGVDVWISPAAPGPAPKGIDTTGDPIMNLPWTHSGLPAITLPAETTEGGLPLGLQCATRAGDDECLLAWAADLDASLPIDE